RATTQYVWAEFRLENKLDADWEYELFFNFFDDAGQLKGQVTREGRIEKDKKGLGYIFDVGWGNDVAGSWKDDRYSIELVFMDTLIATIHFDSSTAEEEGNPDLILGSDKLIKSEAETVTTTQTQTAETVKEESLDELLAKLDVMIGLGNIKKGIREHIDYLKFIKLRKDKGFEESGKVNLHSVFTGNPGTGKTTVVNMLGKIYKQMGLLTKGHIVEVDRADLVGEYIGQTAPKTRKLIEEARGGILFVDEAYSLARAGDDSKDFGKEVVEILLKEMSDGIGDIAIMVAGYPKEMDGFLNSNPGLKSRFSHYYHFDDYLPDELLAIAVSGSSKRGVSFTEQATVFLEEAFIESYRTRDRSFGNARMALGLVDEAKMNMALRLMRNGDLEALDNDTLSRIELEDIQQAFGGKKKRQPDLGINEKLLRDAMAQLNELVGMQNIKTEIAELVKLVRFYRETGKDVLGKFSLHAVFTGNPGTGKTTVARIIADLYKALGLLEKGHLVEVDRQGLVAGYTGQTAIKTSERVEEAIGG
ncbi:MAG: AAA family ATPase, partial [Bacteroidia bacterium]